MITVLVPAEDFAGAEAVVDGDAYRHLFRARRLAVGDSVRVVDGRGRARWAKVAAVDRRSGTLELGEVAPTHEPSRRVEVLVAPIRRERASWLVEKATELGVAAVRFVDTERAERGITGKDLERFERVARASVEQCHRARVPEITGPHPWDEILRLLDGFDEKWVMDLGAGRDETPADPGTSSPSAALLVGPEGGWADVERQALADCSALPVGFGERTLRAETAAVVGAAWLLR
jgi:16S rRNA (uracil1498-N3)-methyltransferase